MKAGTSPAAAAKRTARAAPKLLAWKPDSSSQLVQLGQAERIGAVHDQGVRVRNVEACLNDRRAHEHIELVIPKVDDHLFELMLGEFAVCEFHRIIFKSESF